MRSGKATRQSAKNNLKDRTCARTKKTRCGLRALVPRSDRETQSEKRDSRADKTGGWRTCAWSRKRQSEKSFLLLCARVRQSLLFVRAQVAFFGLCFSVASRRASAQVASRFSVRFSGFALVVSLRCKSFFFVRAQVRFFRLFFALWRVSLFRLARQLRFSVCVFRSLT